MSIVESLRLRMWFVAAPVCSLAIACSPALYGQTDDFPEKLQRGCRNLDNCGRLVAEAEGRVAKCEENTIGRIRCSDARSDLIMARRLLTEQRYRLKRRQEEQEESELERKRLEAEREEIKAREQKRQQEKEAEEQRVREFEIEAERQRRFSEEKEAERDRQREYMRLLSPARRLQQLVRCHNEIQQCDALLDTLLQVAGSEQEKRQLVESNEKLKNGGETVWTGKQKTKASATSEGTGTGRSVKCCDGTLSPTCTCGRASLRGCCSHHRGVCGCE
jgi:hypothetical protein